MSESTRKRLSMNTVLMNARIFDEELDDKSAVKIEPETEALMVKIEVDNEDYRSTPNKKLKHVTYAASVKVKEESMEEDTDFPSNIFDKLDLRNDEQYLTPVKLETDANETDSVDLNSRKSAKRTVFPRESPYKTRQSPYKRNTEENSQGTSFYSKSNAVDKKTEKKRKTVEYERDPIILQRRQKQIEYGKNTAGYDNYIEQVPKNTRKVGDPQTPNKYIKYSRRGWDGLIKQWRLKLHKYDTKPEE